MAANNYYNCSSSLRLMNHPLRRRHDANIVRRYASSSSSAAAVGAINPQKSPVLTVGILRETYDKWERRAPLTPQHVQELLSQHNHNGNNDVLQIVVQPSTNRAFTNKEYEVAGAIISDDLSDANVVLGVKRPKDDTKILEHQLLENKVYMFFSHVIKGQADNMDLLRTILSKNITLIDYECIVEEVVEKSEEEEEEEKKKPKRMVAFGKYAGMAGMMDCFQPLGRRLLWKTTGGGGGSSGGLDSSGHPTSSSDNDGVSGGYSTPFLNCPPAILHCNLEEMKRSVNLLSERIAKDGLPYYYEMGGSGMGEPLVFTMTGKGGNVYNGVREIFDILPHEIISPTDLPQLFHEYNSSSGGGSGSNNKVYGVALDIDDIYQKKKEQQELLDDVDVGGMVPFDRSHFYANPSQYYSTFAKTVLPYTSVLVNCIYWDHRFPRLITKQDMKELYQNGNER